MNKLAAILIVFSIIASPAIWAAEPDREKLHYQATYNGILSFFQTLQIADVRYTNTLLSGDASGEPVSFSALSVSSENYSMVERLYPMRYQFLSFFSVEPARTLLFENLKVTKKSRKTKHKVGLFDSERRMVQLFTSKDNKLLINEANATSVIAGNDQKALPQKYALEIIAPALTNLRQDPIDRLTLLQMIRQQVKAGIQSKSYHVTTGDELMTYKVSVQHQDIVEVADNPHSATKVKIEAYDQDSKNKNSAGFASLHAADSSYQNIMPTSSDTSPDYRHPPVYVWFSRDEKATPLRFVNYHALGDFIVELTAS